MLKISALLLIKCNLEPGNYSTAVQLVLEKKVKQKTELTPKRKREIHGNEEIKIYEKSPRKQKRSLFIEKLSEIFSENDQNCSKANFTKCSK